MTDQKRIIDHLESLMAIAAGKGYKLRDYPQCNMIERPIGKLIAYHCNELDELDCPWAIQNDVLEYINNIDQPDVWEKMFQRSWRKIISDIITKHKGIRS